MPQTIFDGMSRLSRKSYPVFHPDNREMWVIVLDCAGQGILA